MEERARKASNDMYRTVERKEITLTDRNRANYTDRIRTEGDEAIYHEHA